MRSEKQMDRRDIHVVKTLNNLSNFYIRVVIDYFFVTAISVLHLYSFRCKHSSVWKFPATELTV
jgi:hypothetical protein